MTMQPSILVIDDEPDNFEVIEALLSESDYKLYYVANGQDITKTLELCQPDLILLDVMMPGIDGLEVCQQIKALPKWQCIPIMMITALTGHTHLANCLAVGADDFISKPVSGVELRARARSLLRIKHQYDELQNLLKFRDDMVKMTVHDLRQPLTNILLGVKMLMHPQFPEKQKVKKLDTIYEAAERLQVLIDDILQLSLFESGRIQLERTEVDLVHLLESVTQSFIDSAAQKKQSLSLELPTTTQSVNISADTAILRRALDNLVANAIKFSREKREIKLELDAPDAGIVKIRVIDAGLGVPPEMKQKIFERYEVGTLMPEISQLGLGLAFCKMVIEAHDGSICVKDNQPQGSIFEITLPFEATEP